MSAVLFSDAGTPTDLVKYFWEQVEFLNGALFN